MESIRKHQNIKLEVQKKKKQFGIRTNKQDSFP